ncbi:hypothetical protein ACFL3D_03765, partial [Candidatus Omnitrophota bacterium]
MKKVAFLHATVKIKNSIHFPSLILETVPEGSFSKYREYIPEKKEILLAGIIKDLLLSKEFSEIVVVTSDDMRDEPVATICSSFTDSRIPVRCYRISATDEFSISYENLSANDAAWPYIMLPTYGAWHTTGLGVLASTYQADICLLLQADSSLLFDVKLFDELLEKYTTKGIWGKVSMYIQTEFAIVNTKFVEELKRKYDKKIKDMFISMHNNRFMRLDKLFYIYNDDADRENIFVSYDHQAVPLRPLYRMHDLEKSLAVRQREFDTIEEMLKKKLFIPNGLRPSFIDIELVSDVGTQLDIETFRKIIDQGCATSFAVNVYIKNKN